MLEQGQLAGKLQGKAEKGGMCEISNCRGISLEPTFLRNIR